MEKLTALEKQPTLQIHPEDAAARSIADGERVVVWNERGSYEALAAVTDKMLPGVVISQGLWWDRDGKRSRANALTPDRLADMGGGAVFFSTAVDVKRQ
ncbi:Dimethyl sulfoxide reductase DmsA precursor [compost metagenome]